MSLVQSFLGLFSTHVAYADNFTAFIGKAETLVVDPLILLLFALATVYFLYGLLEFIMNQENEEKKTTGKSHMLWGVIGLVIMIGVYSILNIVLNTFHISGIDPKAGTVNLQ